MAQQRWPATSPPRGDARCTPHRCCLVGRLDHGYDIVDHAHVDDARGGGRARPARRRAAAHGLGLVVDIVPNHTGVADAAARTRRGGTCCGMGRTSRTPAGSTSTGIAAGGSAAGARRRRTTWPAEGRGRRAALLRAPLPDRARAPSERRRRARCTTGSTTSWSTGAAPTPSRTTGGSSRHHPGRAAGRGPGGLRRHPRADRCAGARRRDRRAARRPPGRAGRPARLPDAAARAGRRRRLDRGREDPRARRGAAASLAGRRHHRLRRAARGGRGASSTRPARRRSPRCTAS